MPDDERPTNVPKETGASTKQAKPRSRRRRLLRVVLISLASLIVLAAIGILVWANVGVMQAQIDPLDTTRNNPAVSVHETPESFILSPTAGSSGTGLVFIPGAKVSADAYLYKLSGIVAESGTTVVVTKPFLNLAFFDQRPLTTFITAVPDVDTWFVGGHSLGGVRACQYAAEPAVSGLILFASYCANDLSTTDTRVLSLSGTADQLSTPVKIMDAADLLPASTTFFPIDGANHARFGDYGVQPGDGDASIDTAAVRAVITTKVVAFLAQR